MQKYFNSIAGSTGAPISGASVQVLDYPAGTVSTIYSDNGITVKANPITTTALGYFEFFAANGTYSFVISYQGVTLQTITDILLVDPTSAETVGITAGTIDGTTIGATTPSTGSFTDLTVNGLFLFGGTTISNKSGTGALLLQVSPTITTPVLTTPAFSGTATFADASTWGATGLNLATTLLAGTPGYATAGTNAAQFTKSINTYYQLSLQNTNSGAAASTDFIITADDGNDSTHYADFGMNNSAGGGAPFTAAHAMYLYTVDSELDIGALGASGVINFFSGGGTTPVGVGSITSTGLNNMAVGATTPSTGKFTTLTLGSTTLLSTSVSLTNGAAAATATLTNSPSAGNPTKWIPINDNGVTRYIPSW